MIDAAILPSLLRLDPETGRLFWLPRTPEIAALSGGKEPERRAKFSTRNSPAARHLPQSARLAIALGPYSTNRFRAIVWYGRSFTENGLPCRSIT